MNFVEGIVENKGVKIHYIDNELKENKNTPILICPGLSESSKDYIKLMSSIDDRRCIALSFRGRGKSDSPYRGYTLQDHINDIESIVDYLELKEICIMGYSRGVSYALGYSILNPDLLNGLIIGEYPAEHKKMPKGWAKESMDFYKANCGDISIRYEALKAIEKESDQVYFKDELNKINCKVLLLKGNTNESLLSKKDISIYIKNLGSDSIRVENFKDSGHDIKADEFDKLAKVINEFLESMDS